MLKLNNENSNYSAAASGGLASNTRLIPPTTTKTTTLKSPETTDNNKVEQSEVKQKSSGIFHNHLDWLTLNFTKLNQEQFQELTNRTGRGLIVLEQGKPFSQGDKAKKYQNTINSPVGLQGGYNSYQTTDSPDTFYDVAISLSGEYFSALTAVEQWELYRDLYINYFPTCSRVDTSIDDYSFKNIPLNEMLKAFNDGNYFDFQQYGEETTATHPDNSTTTHYFGGKGSKKRVRVYNTKTNLYA